MVAKSIEYSHNSILSHPGITLAEILAERNVKQKELAERTGVSEKHISSIIHGKTDICASYAKKLEYALGVPSSFWMNLQSNYDQELNECTNCTMINEAETAVLHQLSKQRNFLESNGYIPISTSEFSAIDSLRKFLNVSNLTLIPNMGTIKNRPDDADPYSLFVWLTVAMKKAISTASAFPFDSKKLDSSMETIKQNAFHQQTELEGILNQCGIKFFQIPYFPEAKAIGCASKLSSGQAAICVSSVENRPDILWFALFREISHIRKEEVKETVIDYCSTEDQAY